MEKQGNRNTNYLKNDNFCENNLKLIQTIQ